MPSKKFTVIPLRQVAKDTLNRQLRSGIGDDDLAQRVIELRDEGAFEISHEEEESREPRIICSMGLSNPQEEQYRMPPDTVRTRKLLATFDFKSLFIEELGWNRHNARLEIIVDGRTFTLSAVSEKCGMVAFDCRAGRRWPNPRSMPCAARSNGRSPKAPTNT